MAIANQRIVLTGLIVLAGVFWLSSRVAAFPQPDIVATSWLLDVKYNHPKVIHVRLPGEREPRTYWFFTYTVTNKTGEDRNFVPEILMMTDEGDLVRANTAIPPTVFATIKSSLRNPLLRTPAEAVGTLRQGPDNAVDGIAIWAMPDHDVDHVTIFFEGLSGETHEIQLPNSQQKRLLRRTLKLDYRTPGSVERQPLKPWLFGKQEWVVR